MLTRRVWHGFGNMEGMKTKNAIIIVATLAFLALVAYDLMLLSGHIPTTKNIGEGRTWHGLVRWDTPIGEGEVRCANGNIYRGKWQDGGIRKGHLTTSKYEYDGKFQDWKLHGFGIARYKNGHTYIGHWRENRKEGLGRYEYNNAEGHVSFGVWKEGILPIDTTQMAYHTADKVYGIDASRYQGIINWENLFFQADKWGKVPSKEPNPNFLLPVCFAIMKATEGANYQDPTYLYNSENARRCGIAVGAYHFLSSKSTAEEQAQNFIDHAKLTRGDLPPVLDIEVHDSIMRREGDRVCQLALDWLGIIERHYHVRPIIYTYQNFRNRYIDARFARYDTWIAHYAIPQPKVEEWRLWQFTIAPHIGGHDSHIDLDMFNGNYRQFKEYVKTCGIQTLNDR